ncbi:hypothetical protein [Adoxophyes orana nucleopolyhedrovirus]|uniref:hypothetical protein n=1 Tax=Adoxophyes orana nucleopolyhedrovirus TaxID=542343 RepID=UPI0001829C39|nr:hypothetical protein [Adoxophyes orana nucleopolyhedrovirus]ACF05398.1 hypothetical protein [Adoxophyes orana nucleopolyhedrovirus]
MATTEPFVESAYIAETDIKTVRDKYATCIYLKSKHGSLKLMMAIRLLGLIHSTLLNIALFYKYKYKAFLRFITWAGTITFMMFASGLASSLIIYKKRNSLNLMESNFFKPWYLDLQQVCYTICGSVVLLSVYYNIVLFNLYNSVDEYDVIVSIINLLIVLTELFNNNVPVLLINFYQPFLYICLHLLFLYTYSTITKNEVEIVKFDAIFITINLVLFLTFYVLFYTLDLFKTMCNKKPVIY